MPACQVHQKVLLIYGQAGDPSQKPANGTLTVGHHNDTFPAVSWPVCKSQFKALVHLQPGPNRLRLEFSTGKANAHQYLSQFRINYLPLTASPPLHLAILVAKDSPTTFDSSPERTRVEGNGLDTAVRKFRMAACLWQAFTGEQMNRNGFGRRCFRLEEEWQANTLTCRESTSLQMRNEVKIHLIRTNKTLQQIRDPDVAQQNSSASRKGDLFTYAMEAVKSHFAVVPGQPRYVSCLWLDSHWDPKAGTILGHAALGGGNADFRLAVFGSHALHSYPSCLEEVVPAFSDRTPTDTSILANDNNECGSSCETANVGIGAQLHELGHLFGSPHQTSGVMRRDYLTISHTFLVQLPPRKGTGATETRLCLQEDECSWHRLDCLRFRHHPCFRLPDDPPRIHDEDVQVWPVENSGVLATSTAGLAFVELFTGDDVLCRSYIEYGDGHAASYPRQVFVTEPELRNRLPESHRAAGILRVAFHSVGLSTSVVEDFALLASKVSRIRLSNGQAAFRGTKLGLSALLDSKAEELLLSSTTTSPPKLLVTIRVYHGLYVDGIEFVYEDATSQIFGKKGGKSGGSEFALDTRRGETLLGFHVRTGAWIDALQILTSLGRRSEVFGSSAGGSS